MNKKQKQMLLDWPEVAEEVQRHKWIESEKAGRDVGYDYASQDWLNKFADGWLAAQPAPKGAEKKTKAQTTTKKRTTTVKSAKRKA